MNHRIPRWEWRTFNKNLDEIEEQIRSLGNPRNKKSKELYILSSKSNDNIKIRNKIIDIKSLIKYNPDTKLEQWTVLTKSAFPIQINDLVLVFKAFKLNLPYLEKDEYTYLEFINELTGNIPELTIKNVVKNRNIYLTDNVIVEIAEVKFDALETRTIAVEHTDPEKVLLTLKKLRLTDYENVNYIKALKRTFNLR